MASMMPDMPMSDAGMPAEDTLEADTTQGYCIELYVMPDGTFTVSGPEAMDKMKEMEEGEEFSSIGEALKQVLMLIKQNPVGDSGQKSFEAGYAR